LNGPRRFGGTLVGVGRLIRLSVDNRAETGSLEDGRPVLIVEMEAVLDRDVEVVRLNCAAAY
jgi:hypothetical protein